MLINLSNHPFAQWSERQKEEALRLFKSVEDMPFPQIDAEFSEADIRDLTEIYFQKIATYISFRSEVAVHLMGEMTFCFALLKRLQSFGVDCYASTANRNVRMSDMEEKIVKFDFVQFRRYSL